MKRLIFVVLLLFAFTVAPVVSLTQFNITNATPGATNIIIWNGTAGSTTWTPPDGVTSVWYLVIAGGGGSGYYGGAGGAGGYLNGTLNDISGAQTVIVGSRGLGNGTSIANRGYNGTQGGFSVFGIINATGGGYGGGGELGSNAGGWPGGDGGSGGGGGGKYGVGVPGIGGIGIVGQGYNGSAGQDHGIGEGAGGGAGNSASGTTPGDGISNSITGESVTYAVGGYSTTPGANTGSGAKHGYASVNNGTDGIVIIQYSTPLSLNPIPSFTSNVTSGYPPTAVQFNDTSVTDITSWNWSYANTTPGNNTKIIFSTIQNATQSFGVGHWHIGLNVTNASGFAETDGLYSITVSDSGGLLGWNRQDIMMDEIFEFILNVKDARTLSGIPGATAATSNGDNSTTDLFGVVTFSTNYTALVITVGAEGYYSRSVSYVVDRDREETIYLTELPGPVPPPVLNTYTMHPVRIKVVDAWGTPLPHSAITVNYLASTLPSTDTIWLASAFGISTTVATEMTTSSLAMVGSTANDGALTFMMFPALTYGLTITNATIGLNNYQELSPRDTDYVIYCPLASQGQVNNTLTAAVASSLPFYQLNASGGYNLSMIYQDTAGYTTNVRFQVIDYSAGSVLVYDNDLGNPGTGIITDNYTVLVPLGQEYIWRYNATKV